ncbi:hypothetical protein J1N35_010916 [Gossypium stocksii]|uniref:Uncharacterized protein n=1 Tax=Gossypium stocksii TaxID=47602 RepID=A0A9D3W393_9ROSI|nr:hypothetical protein J1N35_010916 [Gossypium stocksii]
MSKTLMLVWVEICNCKIRTVPIDIYVVTVGMDSKGKRDHKDQSGEAFDMSLTFAGRVTVQESKVNATPPTLGCDNSKLNIEALTRVVKEVLE